MMSNSATPNKAVVLDAWLDAVSSHLAVRKLEARCATRVARNRDRERARREARQLFADYYREIAIASGQAA